MKTPITMPNVLAAFFSFVNLEIFFDNPNLLGVTTDVSFAGPARQKNHLKFQCELSQYEHQLYILSIIAELKGAQ